MPAVVAAVAAVVAAVVAVVVAVVAVVVEAHQGQQVVEVAVGLGPEQGLAQGQALASSGHQS